MAENANKTHWLQSPDKNYLGHWDLPNGDDLVLTIDSAKWEKVKNPITGKTQAKRVIRFLEKVKPMICNQTNAQAIIHSTGVKFMEDSKGCKIQLYVGLHKDRATKEMIDCIRVRKEAVMSESEQLKQIEDLFAAKKNKLTPNEIKAVQRVIDNNEAQSYIKAITLLNSK